MKPKPIKQRITEALEQHGDGGFLDYYRLAELVFPEADFPRAFCKPTRGGPPGCYRTLTAAIERHGFYIGFYDESGRRTVGTGNSQRNEHG